MIRIIAATVFAIIAPLSAANAQVQNVDYGAIVERAVDGYILPGFANLADETSELYDAASACGGDVGDDGDDGDGGGEALLIAAYHSAFDAWMGVSHLRLGPTEENDAAFAIAFWPDPKGFTTKTLSRLIRDRDAAVGDAQAFAEVSIAGRGFFALERLLFDPTFEASADGYRCQLVAAITRDLAALSDGIETQWRVHYGPSLRAGDGQRPFATDKEVVQALYSTMKTGAEFTMTARIDRPLGTEDRARPNRAEAWRSGRSNRNIALSLAAIERMYEIVFAPHMPDEASTLLRTEISATKGLAETLPAQIRQEVKTPLGRGRMVTLRFGVAEMLELFEGLLRPSLGLSLTFNALDGD